MKTIKFVLSFMSVVGAALNGYGMGTSDLTIGFIGQIVWISSNAGWVVKKLYEKEYAEVVMFISFWLSASISVAMFIIRMKP